MKHIKILLFVLISFAASTFTAHAQLAECTQKEAMAVKNSMVFVILKQESDEASKIYNIAIKSAMEKYWTFCKFGFVGIDTVDKLMMNNRGLYFIRTFDEQLLSTNGYINVSSIGILRGGKPYDSYKHVEEMAWVYVRKNLWEYAARFDNMVQALQNTMVWKANPDNKKKDIYALYTNVKPFKDKVLYIEKRDLSEKLVDMEKIQKAYKFKVKIVEAEELRQAVHDQDDNVIYMHLTNNRNSSCFFIAAKGGVVLWEHTAAINTQLQLINLTILEELNASVEAVK